MTWGGHAHLCPNQLYKPCWPRCTKKDGLIWNTKEIWRKQPDCSCLPWMHMDHCCWKPMWSLQKRPCKQFGWSIFEPLGWGLPAPRLMGQFFPQCPCREPKKSTEAMAATAIFRWSGSREPISCQAEQKGFCHICFFCPAQNHAPKWRCLVHIGLAAIHYSGSVGSWHWPGVFQDHWGYFLGTSFWPKEWLVHATPSWHHGSHAVLYFWWLCPRWLGHEANFQYQRSIRWQVLHALFQYQGHVFGFASR